MRLINALTADAKQKYTLIGENKERIGFYLYYMPSQQTWFFDIDDGAFIAKGLQLGLGYNILRNYKNLLTYGLMVTSSDGLDPFYINDFVSGRITIFLLNNEEKELIESGIYEAGS